MDIHFFFTNVHHENYSYRRPNRSLASICIGACSLVPNDLDCRLVYCGVVCMAVHCPLVCVSANVHCARGVRVVDWRAAPAQNSLTYFAVQGCLERVDY